MFVLLIMSRFCGSMYQKVRINDCFFEVILSHLFKVSDIFLIDKEGRC